MHIREMLRDEQRKILKEYGLNEDILRGTTCQQYEPGETLMEEGSLLTYLMIVTRGEVRVSTEAKNGRNLILCYYVSSGILGDMEMLSDEKRIYNHVSAVSDVEVIAIPYQMNQDILENNLTFMKHLAKDTALKLVQSSRSYADSVLLTAKQRLSRYILHNSRNNHFSEIMSDVALSTGMSYRHMYRILEKLCEDHILEKNISGYTILNPDALKKEAGL